MQQLDADYFSNSTVRSIHEDIESGWIHEHASKLKIAYESNPTIYHLLEINIDACLAFEDWIKDNPRAYTSMPGKREKILKLLPLIMEMANSHRPPTDANMGYIPVKKLEDPIFWRTYYEGIFSPLNIPTELRNVILVNNNHSYEYDMTSFPIRMMFGLARAEMLRRTDKHYRSDNSINGIGQAFGNIIQYLGDRKYILDTLLHAVFHDCMVPDNFNFSRARYTNELDPDRKYYKRSEAERILKSVHTAITFGADVHDKHTWKEFHMNGHPRAINQLDKQPPLALFFDEDTLIRDRIMQHPSIIGFHDEWQDVITVNLEWISAHVEMLAEIKAEKSDVNKLLFDNGRLKRNTAMVLLYQRYETVIMNRIETDCVAKCGARVLANVHVGIIVDHSLEDYLFTTLRDIERDFQFPDNHLSFIGTMLKRYTLSDIQESEDIQYAKELNEHRQRIAEEEIRSIEYARLKAEGGVVGAAAIDQTVAREVSDVEAKINSLMSIGSDFDTAFDEWYMTGLYQGMTTEESRRFAIEQTKNGD